MKNTKTFLEATEGRYKALVENSGDAVTILSPDGLPYYISPSIERILGYTEDEAMQFNLFSLVHPDDLLQVKQVWEKVLENPGVPYSHNTCRILHKNGRWHWIEGTITNMLHNPDIRGIVDNFRDVTEKMIADQALRDSEEKIRLIMNAAMDAIICIDPQGIITFWNPQSEKIFGWKAEEVIGHVLTDTIIPLTYRELHNNGMKRYMKTGMGPALNKLMELSAINRENKEFPIELTILPIKKGGGEFFCAFIRDISERKKAEEKLEKNTNELIAIKNELARSEKSLREAQVMAHLGSWEADFNTLNTQWSDETYEILGVKKAETIPSIEIFLSFIHPEDLDNVKKTIDTAERSLQGYSFNCRIIRNDGILRYITADCKFILNREGIPARMHGIIRDVTERKKAEEKLRHSESRLKQAQAIAHIGNWELSFATNIAKWSDEAYRIYGLEPAEHQLSYELWLSFIHPEDLANVKKQIEISQASLSDSSMYHRIIRKDGAIRHVLSESKFEFDYEGKPIGLYGIVHDITDRKNNEQELRILNDQIVKRAEELTASNAELERFAYVASHDLQEPLRTVSSFLQLLQKKYTDQLDEAAQQYIEHAIEGSVRMKRLILDLLEYSRVGTNRDIFSSINAKEVLKQVISAFEVRLRETKACIDIQSLPIIKANQTQITQLFQNLISNALKYNKSSVPQIEIGCEEKEESWQFFVKDNGIGIDQKYFDKVFAIFQRLHNRKQFSGTGIGLAICKKIVEKHGGTIWVESTLGQGSTFFFTLKK